MLALDFISLFNWNRHAQITIGRSGYAKKVTFRYIIIKASFSYLPSSSENNFGYITGLPILLERPEKICLLFHKIEILVNTE